MRLVRHSGNGGNKLRTYNLIKQDFYTQLYVTEILRKCPHKSTGYVKFRCGNTQIKVEFGRHKGLACS